MQRDHGAADDGALAPVIDLFGGRRGREVPVEPQLPSRADEVPGDESAGAPGRRDDQGWWVDDSSVGAEAHAVEPDAVESDAVESHAVESHAVESAVGARTRAAAVAAARWSTPDIEGPSGGGLGFSASDEDPDDEQTVPRLPIEEASTWALSRRGLSVVEMRQKLLAKGYADDVIETELDRLLRVRYLDDARLAEEIVRVEFERKGKGRAVVVGELRRRGISPDDYLAALDDIDTELELDRAVEVAYRKMSSSRDLDTRTAERRLSALLARRGFSGDLARAAIARAAERLATGR